MVHGILGRGVVLMYNNNPHLRAKKSLIRCTQQIALTSNGLLVAFGRLVGGFSPTHSKKIRQNWIMKPPRIAVTNSQTLFGNQFPKKMTSGGKNFTWDSQPWVEKESKQSRSISTQRRNSHSLCCRDKENDKEKKSWQAMEIQENPWKTWKPMKIHGNPSTKTWKSMKISRKSTNIPNFRKNTSQPLQNT